MDTVTITPEEQFVLDTVRAFVQQPDAVSAARSEDELGTLIELEVAAEDMPTLIGREGRTAKALRTLLRAVGAKHDARVNLKIIEPEGGRGFTTPYRRDSDADRPGVLSRDDV